MGFGKYVLFGIGVLEEYLMWLLNFCDVFYLELEVYFLRRLCFSFLLLEFFRWVVIYSCFIGVDLDVLLFVCMYRNK